MCGGAGSCIGIWAGRRSGGTIAPVGEHSGKPAKRLLVGPKLLVTPRVATSPKAVPDSPTVVVA